MEKQVRGFTLIELLIVMTVAAVLATIAAPSFKTFMASQRVKSAANEFAMAAILARSEAIKRNGKVVLCVSTSGTGCASSGGWEQGWIAFHDANSNGSADSGEAIVLRQQSYTGTTLTGSVTKITYDNTGRFTSSTTSAPTMAVTNSDTNARCISFDLSGMPRSSISGSATCP